MAKPVFLGRRIRALRLRLGLSQAALARQLEISPSYLNLLEHDRRPVSGALLLELARVLDVDLRTLAADSDAELLSNLMEIFSEPLFEEHPIAAADLAAFVGGHPEIARAVLRLHQAYGATRGSLETLGGQLLDDQQDLGDLGALDRARLSSEQVSDFIQRNGNYFPALEAEAERLLRATGPGEADHDGDLFGRLARHLEAAHGVRVRVRTVGEMRGAVRRFDPERRELQLSELLRRGSRNFQLAAQIALLGSTAVLDELTLDPKLTGDESRALARVALASYFAGAVLMPYGPFLRAAEAERYDVELLGHRFRVGWEQTCHRLTTLRRPGLEGVPFYMLRVDLAGNISKRFGAAGIRFPRFSGLCSLWNVHAAFLQPGRVRVQLSRLPDGHTVLAIARTVQRHSSGYQAPDAPYAVGIGCDAADARRLVYADGIDLDNAAAAVPIGITCRLCERADCTARAFPSLGGPLRIDENVRGVSFYAPVGR
ncbi:MAG TPA: short-chain fatty acyl-CoA regulator family protein [Gemmatimonadales bacterium]|nr:short-chain fatty acyl-CoA regulator family protein [Gemmatimonadales bacterium]